MSIHCILGLSALLAAATFAQSPDSSATAPRPSAPAVDAAMPPPVSDTAAEAVAKGPTSGGRDSMKSKSVTLGASGTRFSIGGEAVYVSPSYFPGGAVVQESEGALGFRAVVMAIFPPQPKLGTIFAYAGYERSGFEFGYKSNVAVKIESKTTLTNQFLALGLGMESPPLFSTPLKIDVGMCYDIVLSSEAETEYSQSPAAGSYAGAVETIDKSTSEDFDGANSSFYGETGIILPVGHKLSLTASMRFSLFSNFYEEGSGVSRSYINTRKFAFGARYDL